MTQKRLLVLSPRFLFPLDQGGRIRTVNTLRNMKGGAFHLTLLSPAPADAGRWQAEIDRVCDRFVAWPEPSASLPKKIVGLAGTTPITVSSDVSRAGRAAVAGALADRPDAILVDFPHAAALLPDQLDIPAIIFTHNVEAEIFSRHAEVAAFPMRLVWQDQARKMRRFEQAALRRCQKIIAVSVRDARALEAEYGLDTVEPIETGVDTEFYAYNAPAPAPEGGGTVVFTGSMDSRSNIDGIEFLMEDIWPRLLERRPKARAIIAGRNPPPRLAEAAASRSYDWTFTGFVDDVRPYVENAHVYAIPLRVGSGTRIKVFEAMAMGAPVVSTSLGVEGLDVTDGENYLAADTAEAFAASLNRLLDDAALQQRLSTTARDLVASRFGWPVVTKRFEAICLSALPGPTASSAPASSRACPSASPQP